MHHLAFLLDLRRCAGSTRQICAVIVSNSDVVTVQLVKTDHNAVAGLAPVCDDGPNGVVEHLWCDEVGTMLQGGGRARCRAGNGEMYIL